MKTVNAWRHDETKVAAIERARHLLAGHSMAALARSDGLLLVAIAGDVMRIDPAVFVADYRPDQPLRPQLEAAQRHNHKSKQQIKAELDEMAAPYAFDPAELF